jgi:hypothetical protein
MNSTQRLPVFASRSLMSGLRSALCLCASVAALAIVACATVDATSTPYVGAPHPPPTDATTVQILRTEPTKPHDRLGEVVVDASVDPAPPIADVEAKLRAEAAKMGADAVVVVLDRVQPVGAYVSGPYWGRSVETITGRKLVGVAIKYK